MKEIIKKIGITLLVIIAMLLMCCEPKEPDGDLIPYMSDVVMIPQKVYAKGKPKMIKNKTLKNQYESLGEQEKQSLLTLKLSLTEQQ